MITDFDLVRSITRLKSFCGTVHYVALEIIEDHEDNRPTTGFYTPRVDMWLLGVMLLIYSLIEGLKSLPQPRSQQERTGAIK